MIAKRYEVEIAGETGLIMHHDNLAWAEVMKSWRLDPANKKASVAGDDRTPPHTWIGNLYAESGRVVIPSDNLMTMMREGGAKCPTGKGQTTYKRQTQSGIVVDQSAWPILVDGKEIPFGPIEALIDEDDFSVHEKTAAMLGFFLFVKRAKIGNAKHVRVRPRFDKWAARGSVTVLDDTITQDVLQNILTFAGAFAGIGDWRPSAPKSPGPWGKFSASIRLMK